MPVTHMPQQAALTHTRTHAPRWPHPFDTAGGTIALGVALTIAMLLALRLLGG